MWATRQPRFILEGRFGPPYQFRFQIISLRARDTSKFRLFIAPARRNLALAGLVNHVYVAIEEPVDLAFEPCSISTATTAVAVDSKLLHKCRQGWAENQFAVLCFDGLRTNPRQKQTGEISERKLVVAASNHDEFVGAILALVLLPAPGIAAR